MNNIHPQTSLSSKNSGVTVNLTDPKDFADGVPHEAFTKIREQPGLYWQPSEIAVHGGYWAVTRWADIVAIEQDTKTFTSTKGCNYPLINLNADDPDIQAHLMFNDPPNHSRLRRAVGTGFAPRVVANFEPWVREIVTRILDGLEDKKTFDYVEEIAETIPAQVVSHILGSPAEDSDYLVRNVFKTFKAIEDTEGLKAGESAWDRSRPEELPLANYARKMQDIKRANPADDMFTALGACVDRGELSQAEFLNWMILMMMAGFETTHMGIAQSMRMYLEDPEVAAMTDRAIEEGITGRAVDEFLRLTTPSMEMARTATRDVELAGTHIREGDIVVVYYVAANRDPAVFAEPDRFNPWRSETNTLVFGCGVHRCPGQYLATLELKILWEEMHRRNFKLRSNGQWSRGWSVQHNELKSLPVARV